MGVDLVEESLLNAALSILYWVQIPVAAILLPSAPVDGLVIIRSELIVVSRVIDGSEIPNETELSYDHTCHQGITRHGRVHATRGASLGRNAVRPVGHHGVVPSHASGQAPHRR